jgi:hypothetical protein
MILTNRHSFFALLTFFIGSFNVFFYETFVVVTLKEMGLDEDKTNYLLAGMVVTYLPMCCILPRCCETFPRKI